MIAAGLTISFFHFARCSFLLFFSSISPVEGAYCSNSMGSQVLAPKRLSNQELNLMAASSGMGFGFVLALECLGAVFAFISHFLLNLLTSDLSVFTHCSRNTRLLGENSLPFLFRNSFFLSR